MKKNHPYLLTALVLLLFAGVAAPPAVFADGGYDLQTLSGAAMTTNPDILQLEQAMEADRQNLAGARASLFPVVKFTNTNTYVANPQAPYVLDKGSLGTLPLSVPPYSLPLPEQNVTVVDGGEHSNFDFAFDITQPLYLWGKIQSNIALRRNVVTADALQLEKKRSETGTMIRVYYYSLYYLDRLVSLLAEQKSVANQMLKIAEDSNAAGQITDAELTEKRMAIRSITHAAVAAEQQQTNVLDSLRYLTGIDDLSVDQISFADVDSGLAERSLPSRPTLVERALANSFDIRLAAITERIHESRVDVARSGTLFKPALALNVELGYSGPRVPLVGAEWESKDNWLANVTVSVNSTLFDGGKARADVRAAEAQLSQARYRQDSAARQVSQYVSQTVTDLETTRENIRYFAERAKDTRSLEAYQKHLLDIGSGSRLEYFQKRVDVYTEEAQALQQQIAYASRYFTLENVTGTLRGE